MTEEEAKTKWCWRTTKSTSMCLGAGCMAWRWVRDDFGNVTEIGGEKHGFCGPAGRP